MSDRPLALVTGASSGIGFELAKQFATHGFDLVVAAESDRLDGAAEALRGLGAEVEAVRADLATNEGVERVHERLAGRPLAAAAINAGIGSGGAFRETDLEHELRLVDLNVRCTVHLGKYVVREMAARGEGRILFTSSIASTHPDPYEAVYGASKAFVQSFAKALRNELDGTGVTVTSLMPGPTETDFFHRANMDDTKIGTSSKGDPAEVAAAGFEALMAGEEQVVPGASNKAIAAASRVLPDRAKAALHGKLSEPGSG
jgi:short-subunit dehydrogenase